MEATENKLALQWRRLLSTRSGTLALAAGVAVLAGLVLVAFLSHYRTSVRGGTAATPALVAGSLIPKGTSGDNVIGEKLFTPTTLPQDQVKDGALADTSTLAGKVAIQDIYPGQQITAADFASKADPVRGKLSGDQRALAVPLDAAHGLIGEIRTGDRIDVLAGFNSVNGRSGQGRPVIRTMLQNVLVLKVPQVDGGVGGTDTANITIRVTDREAAAMAYAADNGKVWFVLRPPAGASQSPPSSVNLEELLSGSNPIQSGSK
jgi:Flp pilus assembly protein CpaB